jgi:hypothetical protein
VEPPELVEPLAVLEPMEHLAILAPVEAFVAVFVLLVSAAYFSAAAVSVPRLLIGAWCQKPLLGLTQQ